MVQNILQMTPASLTQNGAEFVLIFSQSFTVYLTLECWEKEGLFKTLLVI